MMGCVGQIFTLKQIGEKAQEKKNSMCVLWTWSSQMIGLIRKHWQILRMYDVHGKLLNDIKSMYVNSLACVRVKVG